MPSLLSTAFMLLAASSVGFSALAPTPLADDSASWTRTTIVNTTSAGEESRLAAAAVDYDWMIRLWNDDVCNTGDYIFVNGAGTIGCQNLDVDATWNSFSVTKNAEQNIVLFRGRDCPFTENDPFQYDCQQAICNIDYGRQVPRSYLVTNSGQNPCVN